MPREEVDGEHSQKSQPSRFRKNWSGEHQADSVRRVWQSSPTGFPARPAMSMVLPSEEAGRDEIPDSRPATSSARL